MFKVLRNKEGGICRVGDGSISTTTGSQVSVLPPTGPATHWFTGTPNPSCSVFKPFIFCDNVTGCDKTCSPQYGLSDPARVKPRFRSQVDRRHDLYKAHQKIKPLPGVDVRSQTLTRHADMEEKWLTHITEYHKAGMANDTSKVFINAVQEELDCYQQL